MAETYFPEVLRVSTSQWDLVDNAGRFPGSMSAVTRAIVRSGDKWKASVILNNASEGSTSGTADGNSAHLRAFILGMRGVINSVWLKDHSYEQRGSFSAPEVLSNNTFASGTTGWTAALGADTAVTSADRRLRLTRTANTGTGALYAGQAVSGLTQYAPYAARVLTDSAIGLTGSFGASISCDSIIAVDFSTTAGLRTAVITAQATTGTVYIDQTGSTSELAGAYREVPFTSMARCALVDNGPNLLLQSQDLFTTWTKSGLTLPSSNNTDVAPDRATTAETLGEDTGTSEHYLTQSVTVAAAAADYSFSCHFKASSRSFAYLRVAEGTGSTAISAFINLGTGALGTTATGANWSNLRTAIRNMGNGWYRLTITARKTNAATTLACHLGIASADNTFSYLGASLAIAAWGASLAQSSVPVRYALTTTTATSGTAQTGGSIYIKGLPVSSSGLLLSGDLVQISSQLLMVVAPLNSDAAGLGLLNVAPSIRTGTTDGGAVIINQPMAKFMFAGNTAGWTSRPGVFSDATLEFEEDLR